ncbi:cytochrome P450 [Streptomyces fuscichromogenes]|uniref:Cytochrome P-450 like protein n=1 Tax=Streptomyces fuscichromogenes TaxID=1324013 RepID=A0A918CVN3_9ACTN|nr:cytochrome P450 [Streptomyces fuscichromogenes]GGN34006.1 cytochrome P-450 like protein [Streptomyces fuscichromogenes]
MNLTDTADEARAGAGLARSDDLAAALLTPEARRDPYPFYARMRREDPVHRSAQGIWYLTRYADVEAALSDLRLSNDRDRMTRAYSALGGDLKAFSRLTDRLGRVMSNTDPPDHARLRKLANRAFTARRVEALRDGIQRIVDRLIDEAVAAGPAMDLIEAVASPLPMSVVCELFGIPAEDLPQVKTWFHRFGRLSEDIDKSEAAIEQYEEYLARLVRRRRADPGDDLISALVATQAQDDRLTDSELLATCFVLITAGDETTTHLVGNGMLALLRHPGQLARLRAEPTLIRTAVEELARYDTPTQAIVRVAAEDVAIGGRTLREGELAYLFLAATNRDPERFEDPDLLDLTRPGNRHLSFGNGPHFCLGGPLAKLQAEVAVSTLVRRLPHLRLADDAVLDWRPNPLQRRLTALPLTY